MLADGPTNACALTPAIAWLCVFCPWGGCCCLVYNSSNVDRVSVNRRVGRYLAREKTVRNSPLNGEDQLEWPNAHVPRR